MALLSDSPEPGFVIPRDILDAALVGSSSGGRSNVWPGTYLGTCGAHAVLHKTSDTVTKWGAHCGSEGNLTFGWDISPDGRVAAERNRRLGEASRISKQ
eukprot:902359-Pyramimonas_sp.AAC.1